VLFIEAKPYIFKQIYTRNFILWVILVLKDLKKDNPSRSSKTRSAWEVARIGSVQAACLRTYSVILEYFNIKE
jgi:hypothetical protein